MNYISNLHSILKKLSLKKFIFVIILMIVATILEFLGISLIVPFIAILTDQNTSFLKYLPQNFTDIYLSLSKEKIFIYGIFTFFFIYLIKSIYLIFFNLKLNQFVFRSEAKLCSIIFKKYLSLPYTFHMKERSSKLIRNLTEEIHLFAEGILLQGLIVLAEIFVTIFLVSFLLYINPFNTLLIILMILLIVLVFVLSMRKKLNFWGTQRQNYGDLIIKQISEGFGSIKEIILYKKNDFFTKILNNYVQMKSESSIFQNFFVSLPRLTFEFFAISSILLVSIFMFQLSYSLDEILSFVVIFGVICFRLLPASNRILNYIQISIYHKSVIKVIYDQLNISEDKDIIIKKDKINSNRFDFKNKISVENISFGYEKSKLNVLKNINFEIKKNESVGVIGSSGSGKSTLITLLMGMLKPQQGDIKCDNVSIYEDIYNWQNKISYVPQDVFLINDSIKKNIAFGLDEENIDNNKIQKVIDMVFLNNFINSLPNGLDTVVGERGANISGGQKQRIGIARALYRNPQILIMDESTNSLDEFTENELIDDLFKFKKNYTLILISHNKSVFKNFDKIIDLTKN